MDNLSLDAALAEFASESVAKKNVWTEQELRDFAKRVDARAPSGANAITYSGKFVLQDGALGPKGTEIGTEYIARAIAAGSGADIEKGIQGSIAIIDATDFARFATSTEFQAALKRATGSEAAAVEVLFGDPKTSIFAEGSSRFVSSVDGAITSVAPYASASRVLVQTEFEAFLNGKATSYLGMDRSVWKERFDSVKVANGGGEAGIFAALEDAASLIRGKSISMLSTMEVAGSTSNPLIKLGADFFIENGIENVPAIDTTGNLPTSRLYVKVDTPSMSSSLFDDVAKAGAWLEDLKTAGKYLGPVGVAAGLAFTTLEIKDALDEGDTSTAAAKAAGFLSGLAVGTAVAEAASPLLALGPLGWAAYGIAVVGTGAIATLSGEAYVQAMADALPGIFSSGERLAANHATLTSDGLISETNVNGGETLSTFGSDGLTHLAPPPSPAEIQAQYELSAKLLDSSVTSFLENQGLSSVPNQGLVQRAKAEYENAGGTDWNDAVQGEAIRQNLASRLSATSGVDLEKFSGVANDLSAFRAQTRNSFEGINDFQTNQTVDGSIDLNGASGGLGDWSAETQSRLQQFVSQSQFGTFAPTFNMPDFSSIYQMGLGDYGGFGPVDTFDFTMDLSSLFGGGLGAEVPPYDIIPNYFLNENPFGTWPDYQQVRSVPIPLERPDHSPVPIPEPRPNHNPSGEILYPDTPYTGLISPIVVDLDGDGIELMSIDDSVVTSDIDNDGYLEHHAWVGPDDGILGIDLNGNGLVDDAKEFAFASQTNADDTDIGAFASLYDANGDGVFDINDAAFSQALIWQDANSDGIASASEMWTLAQLSVESISLETDQHAYVDQNNIVNGTTSATLTDGSTLTVGDVSLLAESAGYKIVNQQGMTRIEYESGPGSVLFDTTVDQQIDAASLTERVIVTGSGNDTLTNSTSDAVYLNGGAGNDSLSGGANADTLYGDTGVDSFHAGDGNDTLFIDAEDINGLANGNTIDGGAGIDAAFMVGDESISVNLTDMSIEMFQSGGGDDDITAGSADTDFTIIGGAGNDTITGGSGNDMLSGDAGADIISGGAGDDIIVADALDTVDGGAGVDTLTLEGDQGVTMNLADHDIEVVLGSEGDDTFTTNADAPRIMFGRGGNDTLTGSDGNDYLSGGAGNDFLDGGYGDDTYVFGRDGGQDVIRDRTTQTALIDIAYQTYWGFLYIGSGGHPFMLTNADGTQDIGQQVNPVYSKTWSLDAYFANVDLATLNSGIKENQNQLFTQADMNAKMDAFVAANPGLLPAYNGPAYYGGYPIAAPYNWMESVTLGLPLDTTVNTTQTYEIDSGNDTLVFTDGIGIEDIRLQFGYGQNPLNLDHNQLGDQNGNGIPFEDYNGDGQIDEVPTYPVGWADFPTSSMDLYVGIAEDDNPDATASELQNNIRIESFIDFFDLSASGAGGFWNADGERAIETFVFDDGLEVDVSDMKFWDGWGAGVTALNFDANAYANVYNYDVTVANEWIGGTSGNDTVFALGGNDIVMGRGGDDFLYGGDGNDRVYGGDGADSVWGEAGDDYLSGGAGNDSLVGHDGNDTLDGGTGADQMNGGTGDDNYVVDDAGDTIIEALGEGTDTVKTSVDLTLADNVENMIATGAEDLALTGNDLANEIQGNAGNNNISAGAGDDRIGGAIGDDTIDGGDGVDTVIYADDLAGYHVSRTATGWRVEDIDLFAKGYEGVDQLTNVEFLQFVDQTVDLSTLDSAPLAAADQVTGYQNHQLVISVEDLLANDADADPSAVLTITSVSSAANGTVSLVDGNVVFTPLSNFYGQAAFVYSVADENGKTDSAVVGVNILQNSAPEVALPLADQVSTAGEVFAFALPEGTFSDVDVDDTLTYSATLANGTPLPSWLVFDAATMSFAGAPDLGDVGTFDVEVTVSDIAQNSVSSSFSLTVQQAPTVLLAIADQIVAEDSALNFSVPAGTFADADFEDTLTYSATLSDGSALPSWLSFDAATQTFSGTPANGDVGNYAVRVIATDSALASVAADFTLSVTNTNDAPTVATAISGQEAIEDQAFSFVVPVGTFADVDADDTLSYAATLGDGSALPSWLSFDAATQTFSGTPANDDVGDYAVKVIVTDSALASVSADFSLSVANTNDAPTVAMAISGQDAVEDQAFSFVVPAGTFADIDAGDTLSYAATLSDGSALPSWLSFDAATQTFSGTPANDDVGGYVVKVIATDSALASVSADFALSVANTNDAPTVVVALSSQTATEDSLFNFVVPAGTFADVDTGDTLSFSATLDDGTALPSWLSFDAATGTFSGTPANGDIGTLSLKVVATDVAGASASSSFDLEIVRHNDAPTVAIALSSQTATEDQAFNFAIPSGTFVDPDIGDTLTYSATLFDGSALPSWLSFDAATGTFSGMPTNNDVGAYAVMVTATDTLSASVSSSFDLTVINTNDAPTVAMELASQTALEDQAFSFAIPAGTFADVDAGDTLSYSATLSDGSALPVWLDFDAATGTFSGQPANDDVGVYAVRVTATDGASASVASAFELTVTNVNDAPTVFMAILAQDATEDQAFSFTVPAGTFVDVDSGDALSYSATLSDGSALPSWLVFDEATATFSGTPANDDVGAYLIKVTATDGASASVSSTFDLTVTNANDAPTVTMALSSETAIEDQAFSFTVPAGTFSDVDAGDTLAYSAMLDDGSALPSWLTFDEATQTFAGTPANDDVGIYSVKVTATDGSLASVSSTFDLTVENTNDAPTVAMSLSSQAATEDQAFSFAVPAGTFADADVGDTLSYTATLADGSALPTWLSFDPATSTFSGTPANDDVGSYVVKVIATDSMSASVSTTFALTVENTNDAPVVSMALADQSTDALAAFSYTIPFGAFTDVDAGDTLTYTATLADGSALPAWLSFDAATRTFSGTPDIADGGTLSIKVQATDSASAFASSTFSLEVSALAGDNVIDGVARSGLLDGGPGSDTVTYETASAAVSVNLATGGTVGDAVGDSYANIENIVGSDYADTLVGNAGDNVLTGGLGADTLDGGAGFDWASYSDRAVGISVTFGSSGVASTVSVSENGAWVTDTLTNIEGVIGTDFNDTMNGSANADTFRGLGGSDTLNGTGGDDTYVIDANSHAKITDLVRTQTGTVTGGKLPVAEYTLSDAGADTIIFGDGISLSDLLAGHFASVSDSLSIVMLDQNHLSADVDFTAGYLAQVTGWFSFGDLLGVTANPTSGFTRVETFKFADGLTISIGGLSDAASDLTDTSTTFTGTASDEWYSARGGDDIVNGNGGNDVLIGGSGNDTINGGDGNDVIAGGSGNDTLTGGAGFDQYSFGRGDGVDTISQTGADSSGGKLFFGEDIQSDQLWFTQVGQNLEVSVIGTEDKVSIAGFFGTGAREITEFDAGGLKLDTSSGSAAVAQLVSAMASFSPPSVGTLDLPAEIKNDTNVSAALAVWAA